MSRGYRVTWATAAAVVTSRDTLEVKLSLLGILCEDDMCALLTDALGQDGWVKGEDGSMTLQIGDAIARVPPGGGSVEVSIETSQKVQARVAGGQAAANEQLAKVKEKTEEEEKAKIAKQLLDLEPSLRQRVNEVVQKVYLEALKKKAATMGAVESVNENVSKDGSLEVTIRVRV